MTREINSTFEYEGKTYKVIQSTMISNCSKCIFVGSDGRCCPSIYDKIGSCSSLFRTDGKEVHFELVTNNKE